MILKPGTRLEQFRVTSLLGRGGMAVVYRAEDERLGREVALKVLPPEFAQDEERVARFEREVRSAARLAYPNIVPVFSVGHDAGLHYFTMALLAGGDLKTRIRAHSAGVPPAEALGIVAAVARALNYAHGQGVVHRDVKPENILFTEDGTPQLTDFGIVRAVGAVGRLTPGGMSIGSPQYMSPEQAQGEEVDGRSDLYSLGVVLFELLMGTLPFDAPDAPAVADAHVKQPVPSLPSPLAVHQPLLDRLLAKSPVDRFATGAEIVAACESQLRSMPTAGAAVARVGVSRRSGGGWRADGVGEKENPLAKPSPSRWPKGVSAVPAAAGSWWLLGIAGSMRDELIAVGGELLVGRGPSCGLLLDDSGVSRRHAVFRLLPDGRLELSDAGSTNGTVLNGVFLGEPVKLDAGDTVQFSDQVFRVGWQPANDDGD